MSDHLLVFVKNPVPGTVKTRLQARYTPQQAAGIYRAFILDTLESARTVSADRRLILFAPPDAEAGIRSLVECAHREKNAAQRRTKAHKREWDLRPQVESDLGERMYDAAARSFEDGAARVVIIGTDIPSLPAGHIALAFDLLRRRDVVLGPSSDGGYYLVGLSHPARAIFEGIKWSTPHVLSQTLARLDAAGLTLGLLPPWYDIDTPEELDFLQAHIHALKRAGRPFPHHTERCLAALT